MKFTSLLKNIILENSRFEILRDNLTKPTKDKEGKNVNPKMPLDVFIQLVQADPTSRMNNVDPQSADSKELAKIKAGSYTNWLIKNYLNPKTESEPEDSGYAREVKMLKDRFVEDLYKITDDLKKFDRFKNTLSEEDRDINKLTPAQLYYKVKDFSLVKKKASAEEKAVAQETFEHPGSEVIFRGNKWTLVKISDTGDLGKDAALWFGGYHLLPAEGETRWCTSSPGLNYWHSHLVQGPLYVILPNNYSGKRGNKTGLPAERYQFHFPTNQFMDVDDNPIDVVSFLTNQMAELKDAFKPEFAKGLTIGGGEHLAIDSFSSGAVGKFIALYGLNELIDQLPDNLKGIQIQNKQGDAPVNIVIPPSIDRFQNLEMIMLDNCISEIPDTICNLKNLRFIVMPNNKNLRTIPECISKLENLVFMNLKGCDNVEIPKSILEKGVPMDDQSKMFDFQS